MDEVLINKTTAGDQDQPGIAGFRGTQSGLQGVTLPTKLLSQHQRFAGARDVGPVAVEIGHQPLEVGPVHRTLQRGLVRELIHRLMQARIGQAPEPPAFLTPNDFDASGRCSGLYQASNALRLAGSETVARTTK